MLNPIQNTNKNKSTKFICNLLISISTATFSHTVPIHFRTNLRLTSSNEPPGRYTAKQHCRCSPVCFSQHTPHNYILRNLELVHSYFLQHSQPAFITHWHKKDRQIFPPMLFYSMPQKIKKWTFPRRLYLIGCLIVRIINSWKRRTWNKDEWETTPLFSPLKKWSSNRSLHILYITWDITNDIFMFRTHVFPLTLLLRFLLHSLERPFKSCLIQSAEWKHPQPFNACSSP